MELLEIVQEVKKAVSEVLASRNGQKISLNKITVNLKIWENLDSHSITDVMMAIEDKFPQLQKVAGTVKETFLEGAHTLGDIAKGIHEMLEDLVEKGK